MLCALDSLPRETARCLQGVFFDIDDTFTTEGKIPECAFKALWRLHDQGIKTVPITGRPAGWCDHIARMWPVDGVVGENGAFYFYHDPLARRLVKRFRDPDEVRAANRLRLKKLAQEILESVPGTALASDQGYRESDLAIDFCEDVPPLDMLAVNRICSIFERHGAQCKVSSVHVNGWFGSYDKLGMTRTLAAEIWNLDLDAEREAFVFCGDSPNDEPMFAFFPNSFGVNNVLRFSEHMTHLPTYVASRVGGQGFAEIIDSLLALRA